MTKFKVGDKFIPRKPKEEYPDIAWVGSMDEYDGKILTVAGISENGWIEAEECIWYFNPDWCEKVEDNHIPEVGKMVDWEQRRYELAKAAMQGMITSLWGSVQMSNDFERRATNKGLESDVLLTGISIMYADEMIKQLKGGNG